MKKKKVATDIMRGYQGKPKARSQKLGQMYKTELVKKSKQKRKP